MKQKILTAFWSLLIMAGSSATLAMRITWLNDKWEQLWQNKPLAA